jgi:hypothetical protein
MNVSLWDKKHGDWLYVERVCKLEGFRTAWMLYLSDGTRREYKRSTYDLISVDTY